MGSHQDIMHQFVSQEIRRYFSPFDNWVITPLAQSAHYGQAFLVDRNAAGKRESKLVQVLFEKQVVPEMLAPLPGAGRSPYGLAESRDRILIVPQQADTSALPPEVRVHSMQSFSFAGKDLVWMKKPGRKSPDNAAEAVP
jgi:hypothetical protein